MNFFIELENVILKNFNCFFLEYETPTGRVNNGVCTKWLQPMIPNENTEAWLLLRSMVILPLHWQKSYNSKFIH